MRIRQNEKPWLEEWILLVGGQFVATAIFELIKARSLFGWFKFILAVVYFFYGFWACVEARGAGSANGGSPYPGGLDKDTATRWSVFQGITQLIFSLSWLSNVATQAKQNAGIITEDDTPMALIAVAWGIYGIWLLVQAQRQQSGA